MAAEQVSDWAAAAEWRRRAREANKRLLELRRQEDAEVTAAIRAEQPAEQVAASQQAAG